MSKRFLIYLIILAGIGVPAVWWLIHIGTASSAPPISDKEIYALETKLGIAPPPSQSAPKAIPWKQTVRLGIGDLCSGDEAQNRQLGDLIAARLGSSRGLELVERQELDAVLKEQQLNLSGLVRARDAVRVGKLLRADWFLLGSIARVNGTNALVIRLVDARSGIMCDGAVFTEKSMPALAAEVADFVGQARQDAAEAKPRVYLAIGTFDDLSLNSRQIGFATQLRGYLTAAYQHSRFTLLEREYAEILYQEMELDLAGLTEGSATNAPAPIQSAFWLVDGCYQSYETTNDAVEITFNISRMFSTSTEVTLRGLPGEPVCRDIKEAIDGILDKPAGLVMPTRVSEARLQLRAAESLAGLKGYAGVWIGSRDEDEQEAAVERHNVEEAIRALDIVLLLEPTNRAAKFDLAACFRNQNIARVDEARNLYRELLEEPVQDNWTVLSKWALQGSFQWSSADETARWYEEALHSSTNAALDQFYRENAETAQRDANIQNGEGDVTKLAEQRLLETIQSQKNAWNNISGSSDYGDFGLGEFAGAFPDNTFAARKMVEFLPTMKAKFPELAPHLTAAVLTFQTDTNSPVVAEFQKQLEWCQANPKELYKAGRFWSDISGVFVWLYNHGHYQLALQTMKGWQSASNQKLAYTDSFTDEKRVALGIAYAKAGQWRPAMEIFDSYSNMPVLLSRDWPWGDSFTPVLTGVEANYCRKKLSLPVARDPREFQMDKPAIYACGHSSFAVDNDGLWIGNNDKLIHLNFDLETNLELTLPKDPSTPVNAICVSPSKLWIGTGGDGLIEFDKASRQCRRYTVQDGLMMNEISCVRLSGNTLWIGYGYPQQPGSIDGDHADNGGIGFLNVLSHQFTSFTPSLNIGSSNQPPRDGVRALAAQTSGDVWFLTKSGIQHFQRKNNHWEVVYPSQYLCCLATDAGGLYIGEFDFVLGKCNPGTPGVSKLDFQNGQWKSFPAIPELPSNTTTTITPDDGKLWVGGTGYIALLDPRINKLCNFTHIWARTVDQIQIGGGYMWAKYNGYLHRAALSTIQ